MKCVVYLSLVSLTIYRYQPDFLAGIDQKSIIVQKSTKKCAQKYYREAPCSPFTLLLPRFHFFFKEGLVGRGNSLLCAVTCVAGLASELTKRDDESTLQIL